MINTNSGLQIFTSDFKYLKSYFLEKKNIFRIHKGLVSPAIQEHSKLTTAHGIIFKRVYPKHVQKHKESRHPVREEPRHVIQHYGNVTLFIGII